MIKNFDEAVDNLFKIELIDDYSLDKIIEATKLLWNPQDNFKIIHIAWTNWKWSIAKMLFSILKKAWKKVWIFTSPHLLTIKERFQDNDWLIWENDFVECLNKILELNLELSYFEKCFLISLLYFQNKNCEYFILEVWIWWKLDSTNIVNPIITAIVSIWFDHEDFLWNTLEEISEQKAWIIKPWVPIFINHKNQVIEKIATKNNSPLFFTNREVKTNLLGDFQKKNAGIAYEIAKYLKIEENIILDWLQNISHNWRLQFIKDNILIDWAHNKNALQELKKYITNNLENKFDKIIYCFWLKKWKNLDLVFDVFWKNKDYIWVLYKSEMLEDLTKFSEIKNFKTKNQILIEAEKNKNNLYLIFWSLYMIGEFLK